MNDDQEFTTKPDEPEETQEARLTDEELGALPTADPANPSARPWDPARASLSRAAKSS